MDVGNPSNFERLKDIFRDDYKKMGEMITGEWVDDNETIEAVSDFYEREKRFIDPHTAVGYTAAERYMKTLPVRNGRTAVVTLSPAHPGKFLEVVEKATGIKPPLPAQLERLLNLKKESVIIDNSDEALKKFLKERFA